MENQDITCRFGFKTCNGNLKPIAESLEKMLDTLLPKINPALNEASFICTTCKDVFSRCFEFKSRCLSMQKNKISNINIGNAKANPTGVGNPEHLNTCSLCNAVLKTCSLMSLDNADDDMLNEVFESCIPELDLSVTMKPAICKACYEHLQIYFNVMRKCSMLEKTAMVYKCLLSPQDVLKLTTLGDKCKENENNVDVIKIEETFCEKENKFNYEELEDAKSIDVLKFTRESVLTANDGIEVDGIKTEGAFCEKLENEDETKQDDKDVTAPQAMSNCTSREIYEANEVKKEETAYDENETEFDQKNYIEMEDTKCQDLIQFTFTDVISNDGSAVIDVIKREETFCEEFEIEEVKSEFCFVDHKPDNLRQSSSKHALMCDEEGAGNFTETDDGKFLHYNNERIEIVPMDGPNFDRIKDTLLVPKISTELQEGQSCLTYDLNEDQSKPYDTQTLTEKSASAIPMFKCNSCFYQTKYKKDILTHFLQHKDPSEITVYKCDTCSYHAKNRTHLVTHFLKHKDLSEITMYKCDFCLFHTKYKTSLKRHLQTHRKDSLEVTIFKCGSCLYQTRYKSALKSHLLQHKDPSEITTHKCDSCSYQTKHKINLKRHVLIHQDPSEVTMYKCDSCSYQTKVKMKLKQHLLRHKDPAEITMFKCESCSYEAKRMCYLKAHLLKHKDPSEVTMYKCDFCSFQTKHKMSLKQHILKHKDDPEVTMYKCDSCSFETKRKQNLERHILKHKDPSEVTMYKCDFCSFQTKHKISIEQHILKHKD